MKWSTVYGFLRRDLQDIETLLAETINAEHPILRGASTQLLRAGGKRIRPIFVLLASYFGDRGKHKQDILTIAVALELIHMATLVHDDVVDNAELRRGEPTIKHLYGNRVAMYIGDYMLARALEVITTIKQPQIHQSLSKTLVRLVEGEIAQIEDKYNMEQGIRDYLRRIKRKTALLIATSCKLGALAAGATENAANKLYRYGYHVGISFQIIDDILDFTSSEQELGKPTGSDLIQGNITLPIFYAMKDPGFYAALQNVFHSKQEVTKEQIEPILNSLHTTNAIQASFQLSNRYLQKALGDIQTLPNNRAKRTMQMLAVNIGGRRS